MPLLRDIDHHRLHQTTLANMRRSFESQTPAQRQQTLERVQTLLERERQREHVKSPSCLWKYARQVYGVSPMGKDSEV